MFVMTNMNAMYSAWGTFISGQEIANSKNIKYGDILNDSVKRVFISKIQEANTSEDDESYSSSSTWVSLSSSSSSSSTWISLTSSSSSSTWISLTSSSSSSTWISLTSSSSSKSSSSSESSMGFGNWREIGPTGKSWKDVMVSDDGNYIVAAEVNGYIWTCHTSNLNSWTQRAHSSNWSRVYTSNSGQYITAISGGTLFVSQDWGDTFVEKSVYNCSDIRMTYNGQYQYALAGSGSFVYQSTNYGTTWAQYGNALPTVGYPRFIYISNSGYPYIVHGGSGLNNGGTLKTNPITPGIWENTEDADISWLYAVSKNNNNRWIAGTNGSYMCLVGTGGTDWVPLPNLRSGIWNSVAISSNDNKITAINNWQTIISSYNYTAYTSEDAGPNTSIHSLSVSADNSVKVLAAYITNTSIERIMISKT
jgi:hypothetical protein